MIKIKYLIKNMPRISRGSEDAVGYDVAAQQPYTVYPGTSVLINTGIALEMPRDIECQIRPRSGLATKQHLIIPNSPGTLDPEL